MEALQGQQVTPTALTQMASTRPSLGKNSPRQAENSSLEWIFTQNSHNLKIIVSLPHCAKLVSFQDVAIFHHCLWCVRKFVLFLYFLHISLWLRVI